MNSYRVEYVPLEETIRINTDPDKVAPKDRGQRRLQIASVGKDPFLPNEHWKNLKCVLYS